MDFKLVSNDDRKVSINLDLINAYTSRYLPNTSFDFEIVRRQAKKSDPMRKYYFAEIMPKFTRRLGYEPDETLFFHHQLKVRYFGNDPKHEIYQDERGIWRNVPSVFSNDSDLVISVKKQFVDWVIRKAAEHGVYIEDPGGDD